MALSDSFYWHDYETFGRHPGLDRPVQFAGLRTDAALVEQGEPLMIYCRPPEDYLPHPEACLIHGITPQFALEHGLVEKDFVARILAELARPGTCGVGYNSIRFDDEFTRHALFRNFHDPYRREWDNGNSRWDLLDVMRMARTLRPEGMRWPERDGRPSFKLELLTRENGIEHGDAHDALADVRATVELARRLRAAQPRLFDYALKARDKRWVLSQLDVRAPRPVLHFSGRFPAENGSAALMLPLAMHPENRNSVIACNLGLDIAPLLELDAPTLRRYLYTRRDALPAGVSPVPLKEIHANRSPMFVPEAMLTDEVAARCNIDVAACSARRERLLAERGLPQKLREVHALSGEAREPLDPEADLYGGFLSDADRRLAERVCRADGATLAAAAFPFADARLPELLFRYRARNHPASLTDAERARWREHCHARLHGPAGPERLNLEEYQAVIESLRSGRAHDAHALAVLDALSAYGRARAA